jgi:predicted nucleic acid-binding Zn ribbon protein
MATYIYETIPKKPKEKPRRFEVEQSMSDPPLKKDPKTGLPVRRIIVCDGAELARLWSFSLHYGSG